MYRRRTGQSAGVRALPWTLPAAIVCVAISRLLGLEPAYLYGLLLGLVFQQEISSGQEGVQTAVRCGVDPDRGAGRLDRAGLWSSRLASRPASVGGLLLSTALAVVVVGGLEAVAFGLLPLRFLAGDAVYRWRRLALGAAVRAQRLLLHPPPGRPAHRLPVGAVAGRDRWPPSAHSPPSARSRSLFWAYFRFRRPAPRHRPRTRQARSTSAAARRIAWTDASASASEVDQLLTLIRMAPRPCQVGAAHPGRAICLHPGDHRLRARVVAETGQHLVEHHVVQDLHASRRPADRPCGAPAGSSVRPSRGCRRVLASGWWRTGRSRERVASCRTRTPTTRAGRCA